MHRFTRIASFASVIAPMLFAARTFAQDRDATGAPGNFVVRDFRFADGSVLPELRIHYVTLGSPRPDASGIVRNAVLILHGTTGNGEGFLRRQFAGELFGPGELLDTATHYIILPDGIGTRKSTNRVTGCMRTSRTTATTT